MAGHPEWRLIAVVDDDDDDDEWGCLTNQPTNQPEDVMALFLVPDGWMDERMDKG